MKTMQTGEGDSMARARKDGQYLNVKIDSGIYHRLDDYCAETGCTKTAAVERALAMLMNHYETDRETLRRIADGSVTLVDAPK